MSIFESFRKKQAPPPERQEPPALNPERASASEAVDPNEPTLTMPERGQANDNGEQLAAGAFAQGPETLEERNARKFAELAQEFNMTPEDLKGLEQYRTGDGDLRGIRGTINGVAVDIKQTRESGGGANGIRVIGTMDGREMVGSEVEKEYWRLDKALEQRRIRGYFEEAGKDEELLAKVQGRD